MILFDQIFNRFDITQEITVVLVGPELEYRADLARVVSGVRPLFSPHGRVYGGAGAGGGQQWRPIISWRQFPSLYQRIFGYIMAPFWKFC